MKPQNIMFDTKLKTGIPKIIDFGIAAKLEGNQRFTKASGTVYIQ